MGNAFSLHRRTLLLASLAAAALPSFPADAAVRRELRYATLGLDTSDPHGIPAALRCSNATLNRSLPLPTTAKSNRSSPKK